MKDLRGISLGSDIVSVDQGVFAPDAINDYSIVQLTENINMDLSTKTLLFEQLGHRVFLPK